jgi:hypothetical protein
MIYLFAPNQVIGTIYKMKLLKGNPQEKVIMLTSSESIRGIRSVLVYLAPGWNVGPQHKEVIEALIARDCVIFELQHVFG